ncbi:MAG: SCO family protein [Candidatus Rokubacteria bacterium]|nr:SCO family protein [Candidatus Rokubacteria bacterium]
MTASGLALALLLGAIVAAPSGSAPPQPRPGGRLDPGGARQYFTDVTLVDHEGRSHRLYSDLLRGKVVVVNSFYTSCTESCPVIMGKMSRIQAAVGERLGRDVHLVSLTVDPATDTPARLKEYAARLGVRPGWYLVSGEPRNVSEALRKLGHATGSKEAHTNLLIVGNERTGLWKKATALAHPDDLVRLVEDVLDDR